MTDDQRNLPLVIAINEIEVGDEIAYLGDPLWNRSTQEHDERTATAHDWLRVSRIDEHGVHGFRVAPQDWEREVEFVVIPEQIRANGVLRWIPEEAS